MINLINVNKIYNKDTGSECHALRDLTLTINKGEMIAIQGRSGSGKSTLLNIIGCIDTLTSGSYILNSMDVTKLNNSKLSKMRNEFFGFVLQDFGLIMGNSAIENVALPLYFSKVKFSKIKKLSEKALSSVGMEQYTYKKVSQLSGGQKQRVAIARAIVNNPEVILSDEPTGALDSQTAEEIMNLLKELNKKGKTVIIVTHDDKVADCCSRKIQLCDGSILTANCS